MIQSTVPGYPRIGRNRELKKAIESYWEGKVSRAQLEAEARTIRRAHLERMRDSGLSLIPVGDFSFYDGMLDTAARFGWIPERYSQSLQGSSSPLDLLFAAARGTKLLPPLEMTKWFDTNYHYIVPELSGPPKLVAESEDVLLALYRESREIVGERAKPVMIGPYTFLRLAHGKDAVRFEDRLDALAAAYAEILKRLKAAGAEWVQVDEPALVFSGPIAGEAAIVRAYETMRAASPRLCVQTYFGPVWERRELIRRLPVDAIGLDLVRGHENWGFFEIQGAASSPSGDAAGAGKPGLAGKTWVAGVLDGRNIWRADLESLLTRLAPAAARNPGALILGTSSSLQFLPNSFDHEKNLDPELRSWLASAEDRLEELEILRRGLEEGAGAIRARLDEARRCLLERAGSPRTVNSEVRSRLQKVGEDSFRRLPLAERRALQARAIPLPLLPTTTIGSFPQTPEVRKSRSQFKSGRLTEPEYREFVRGEIEKVIRLQEEIGLDVLVHGEFERSDMVDYFGEQLEGMAVTENGWVQSYGTRCTRPPIIYGDVRRSGPMTVRESRLAQMMTRRPVKGMLTGPVTILNWSFPREDLSRKDVAYQLAWALREEAIDLEAAGIRLIQIDEPAFREGLPLREEARTDYLNWAVQAFRLASSGVKPETQIHTHMCYSEFNEILSWIAAMDADVISIENSRSSGELLRAFRDFRYSAGIGPGVYDIHSPRIPPVAEMVDLLNRTLEVLPASVVWVNPDCGLKTRGYQEVVPSLQKMVEAAKKVRATVE